MDRQHRVEEMRQPNAMRFRYETEKATVAIKTPWTALCGDLDPRLVVSIEQLVGDLAARIFVGQFDRCRPEPLRVDHGDEAIRQNALHRGVGSEVFKLAHLKVARANCSQRWLRRSFSTSIMHPYTPFRQKIDG